MNLKHDTLYKIPSTLARAGIYKSLYETIDHKLEMTMQSMGSNPKTKLVRAIIPKNYTLTLDNSHSSTIDFGGYLETDRGPRFMVSIFRSSPETQKDLFKNFQRIDTLMSQNKSMKTDLSSASLHKIEKNNEEMIKIVDEITPLVNYNNIIDAFYFEMVKYIIFELDKGKNSKLVTLVSDIYTKLIIDAFKAGMKLDKENGQLFQAIIDFCLMKQYTDATSTEVLRRIKITGGEKVTDQLSALGLKDVNGFEELPRLLYRAKILKTDTITFSVLLKKKYSELVYNSMISGYGDFCATILLLADHSGLFPVAPKLAPEQVHKLQEIIHNYKSKIRGV